MTNRYVRHRSLAAAITLVMGLSALATAPAYAEPNFGASAEITTSGMLLKEGGDGSFSASKTYTNTTRNGHGITGYGAADLSTGQIHASSLAVHTPCSTAGACDPMSVASSAAMWDSVVFSSKNGKPRENISLIPTSIEIDGKLLGAFSHAKVRSYFGFDPKISPDSLPWIELTEARTEVLDNLFVPLTDDPMYIYIELWTLASTNGDYDSVSMADFGNTLHFNWELPDDLVANSASGVFMTNLSSAVPEPATWAMMIIGFGVAGGALRRRPAAARGLIA